MRDPKEAFAGVKAGNKPEVGAPVRDSALQAGKTTETRMEICHGSVCLGNQKPTNCICPTVKK